MKQKDANWEVFLLMLSMFFFSQVDACTEAHRTLWCLTLNDILACFLFILLNRKSYLQGGTICHHMSTNLPVWFLHTFFVNVQLFPVLCEGWISNNLITIGKTKTCSGHCYDSIMGNFVFRWGTNTDQHVTHKNKLVYKNSVIFITYMALFLPSPRFNWFHDKEKF